jgi:L-asparaginase II
MIVEHINSIDRCRLRRVGEAIVVEVRRGGVVEAVHRVHAAAVRDGELVAAAGNAGLVSFLRSSAKPFQALPLGRARPDLHDRLLAIACASHHAEPEHLSAVCDLLAAVPATEDELACGEQEGRPPGVLHHNCSGKHAGMLAVCRAHGWPTEGYWRADRPLQQALHAEVAAAAELPENEVVTAIDGCSVLTFALPLDRMARMFARLERLDGGARAAAAMRAHPQLIGGERSLDTRLMRALPGWVAKGGAEGLFTCASPDGTGYALKVEDGNQRALPPALARFLPAPLDPFARVPVLDTHGEEAGEVVAA